MTEQAMVTRRFFCYLQHPVDQENGGLRRHGHSNLVCCGESYINKRNIAVNSVFGQTGYLRRAAYETVSCTVRTPNSASSCSTNEAVLLISKSGEPFKRIYRYASNKNNALTSQNE